MATIKKAKPPVRRKPTMPRVTNQDINDRLIRLEETIKPVAEGVARVGILQEGQIRTEGALREHNNQLGVLFDKSKETVTSVDEIQKVELPKLVSKINSSQAAGRAILGTLTVVVGIVMAIIGYFVSVQSGALRDISDNTRNTAAAVVNLDKRLSVAEYELTHVTQTPTAVNDTAAHK